MLAQTNVHEILSRGDLYGAARDAYADAHAAEWAWELRSAPRRAGQAQPQGQSQVLFRPLAAQKNARARRAPALRGHVGLFRVGWGQKSCTLSGASITRGRKKGRRLSTSLLIGSGGRIRTCDLRVMSPTSCQTAPPRDALSGKSIGTTCRRVQGSPSQSRKITLPLGTTRFFWHFQSHSQGGATCLLRRP